MEILDLLLDHKVEKLHECSTNPLSRKQNEKLLIFEIVVD